MFGCGKRKLQGRSHCVTSSCIILTVKYIGSVIRVIERMRETEAGCSGLTGTEERVQERNRKLSFGKQ